VYYRNQNFPTGRSLDNDSEWDNISQIVKLKHRNSKFSESYNEKWTSNNLLIHEKLDDINRLVSEAIKQNIEAGYHIRNENREVDMIKEKNKISQSTKMNDSFGDWLEEHRISKKIKQEEEIEGKNQVFDRT
jgi:hypothetical protein